MFDIIFTSFGLIVVTLLLASVVLYLGRKNKELDLITIIK
jgi:hypothetical protein